VNEDPRADDPCYDAEPPAPPARPDEEAGDAPGMSPEEEAAAEQWIADRIAAIEAAGGADPRPPCAYHMVGGAGELVIDTVVCDISQPFSVTGGKITVKFTPNSGDPLGGGTYKYSGDFGNFSAAGRGTYRVKLTADGGSIVAKGPGSVTTPRGTFSASDKERYDLTPASC
jgi:hypothetical protein